MLPDMSILIGQKLVENAKSEKLKWDIFAILWTKAWGRPVLPDMSILIGHKLVENAKIEKLKCDIFGDFQTQYNLLLGIGDRTDTYFSWNDSCMQSFNIIPAYC